MSPIWFTFIFTVHIACVVCHAENKDVQNIGKLAMEVVDNRIFKGKAARIKNHPYQVFVAIIYTTKDLKRAVSECGGAILRPNVIITAAHCIPYKNNVKKMRVRAGSSFSDHGGVIRKVAEVFIHKSFKQKLSRIQTEISSYITFIDYDVALLKLSESLEYSETIKNVEIPKPNDRLVPGNLGTIAGWGFIFDQTETTVLQKTVLPVMNKEECKRISNIPVTPRMLCAGYYKKDTSGTCKGDSGSAFVANNKIYGIASSVITKCNGDPSITLLTDISAVRTWITTKLNELS